MNYIHNEYIRFSVYWCANLQCAFSDVFRDLCENVIRGVGGQQI